MTTTNTHIYYHDIEVPIITNLKTGDTIRYDGKNYIVRGFSYCRGIPTVFVDIGEHDVSFSILQELHPHLQSYTYRTTAKDVKLYRQQVQRTIADVTFDDTIYQFVYTLPDGVKYPMQPFSLRYLYELRAFVNWTEWDVNRLTDPVEVGFALCDGIITQISDHV